MREQQNHKANNLLRRQFHQEVPNEVWVTDTTELTYGPNNKVRLHVILDLYGQYPISYFISPTENTEAVIKVFELAKQTAGHLAPMIHTDRGAAYTSENFNHYLARNNCLYSYSAPGTPADNAVIEH